MIEEAQDLYQRGDYAGAYALYQKMLDDEPDNHEVLFMMALCRQRQENLSEAADLLSQAILNHPTHAMYHYSLGGVRLRLGQLQGALASYAKAAEINPNYAEAHVGVGYTRLIQKQYPEAEAALRLALRADPRVTSAHAHLGVALLEQQRNDEAMEVLREAAEIKPDDAYIQTQLGRAMFNAGHHSFAAQCFRNALTQFADQAPLWLWLAQSLTETNDDQEAHDAYRRSLDLGGETPEALFGMGRIHLRHGDAGGALNMLMRVLRLNPEAHPARILAAQACRTLSRHQEALNLLQPLAEDHAARQLMARLHLDLWQPEQARAQLAALSLAGDSDPVLRMLTAEALLQQEDWAAAGNQLAPLLEEDEPAANALLLEARRLHGLGQAQEALDTLSRISDEASSLQDELRDWRVRLLHEAGQAEEAWNTGRENAQREAGMIAAIDETAPEGEPTDAEPEAAFERDIVWSWPPRGPNDDQPDPILVYGWPGSAREPLLTALNELSGVQVLRDAFGVQEERRQALCWPRGVKALSELDEAGWRLRRRRYWREVRRVLPRWERMPLVDGLWFGALSLPTIYRLFPTARVVVLRRPQEQLLLDWSLSAYADVSTMHQHWLKEEALLEKAMDVLPLQWIVVDERELRDDPETALQALCQQLPQIDENLLVQRFQRISRARQLTIVDTASYSQYLSDFVQE